MRVDERNRKVYGYVVYIQAYATANNKTYDVGTLEVIYGGAGKSFLGNEGFEPYKSEESAKRGRNAWEKVFERLDSYGDGWRHHVGGVMAVTEKMYQEIEDQFERDCEIISKAPNPVAESLTKAIEKELRRKNFKIVK